MDRGAVAASMKKAAKDDGGAPKEAFVRAATDDEFERATEDTGGSVPRGEQRKPGRADGGVYLEPPGGKNVRTVPDQRALENMRLRAAKRQGQTATAASAPVNSAASAPVQAREDWEASAPASGAPARPAETVVLGVNDLLTVARHGALCLLNDLPPGMELFVGGAGLDQRGVQIVMGLGLLIGHGLASYRGDGHYRITEKGRTAYKSEGWENEQGT